MIDLMKVIPRYWEFAPEDTCGANPPDAKIIICNPQGTHFIQPQGETTESFLDRIERSNKRGENLFYKEWKTIDAVNLIDDR